MRDIALTVMVALLLPMIFKHPVLGAYLWAWLSMMNPHKMAYGFARGLPFAQVAAVVTLTALLMTRQRKSPPLNALLALQLALFVYMSFTSLFALAPANEVLERWIFVLKIQFMMLITMMLVVEGRQLRWLVWVVTLSVAFFGVKGGIHTLVTGGGSRVWGPPGGMLAENNALAVGLIMLMPMMYFLRETETNKWIRRALLFMMITCAFSILGSQSRGALLAGLAMATFLGLKGKHPIRTVLFLVILVPVAIAFMPDTWSNRMETLRTYDQDTSAMSRIWTWHTLWNAAVDRPLLGAGFRADNPVVFNTYAPLHGDYAIFAGRIYVAHSIYFQVLGEHGFVALALFLALLGLTWTRAGRIARLASTDPEYGSWMPTLMRMVQVSLIGYAVGGAFLSLAYHDLPYYIIGFVIIADGLLRHSPARAQSAGAVAQAPPAAGAGMRAGASLREGSPR